MTIKNILPDLPSGPLDVYRKQASFSWKKLITLIDGEEGVKLRMKYYNFYENDPLFKQREFDNLDEERKFATLRAHKLLEANILSDEELFLNPELILSATIAKFQYCPSHAIKHGLTFDMFRNVLITLGNESHMDTYSACSSGKISGSFALTEIGHGTNTKNMQTVAKFDTATQCFILNSNNFEAAKCWSGSLGKCSTHSIIWARLLLPNEEDMGLHAFVVKIRDPETGLPYPGVTVGDMGKKAGLNGVDNGFVLFNNYSVPKESLLNKTGDVTSDGKYVTPYKGKESRSGASFGALSGGRITIIQICLAYLSNALTIATRYAAVRKQFGPDPKNELPIIEYQLTQCRLFPYLAAAYCLKIFGNILGKYYMRTAVNMMIGNVDKNSTNSGPEIHGLSSAAKPLASWIARDAIQECREICGGHGFLKASGIPDLRNGNDANCTYEGDNNVLLQQTSNWLMQLWAKRNTSEDSIAFKTPFQSVEFLLEANFILSSKKFNCGSIDELTNEKVLLDSYKWLICYLLSLTSDKVSNFQKSGKDLFTARNDSQVFYAKPLSIAFIEHSVLSFCFKFAYENASTEPELQNIVMSLTYLYGIWSLEKHLSFLYQGGYLTSNNSSWLFKDAIITLCARLKPEAVSLADAIAPPDFILNSILGCADGQVYKHMLDSMLNNPETFTRPSWWNDIKAIHSKL